ncbi:FecR domain-containing protein [Bordetella genomosp. 1]|nr:FecR domain-containing protein [Bordetella genomosp. 1]
MPASPPSPGALPDATAPSHAAMEAAAEWFALLRSGEATARERAAWQTWLDAQAEHRHAWRYVERIGQRFAPIQASGEGHAAVAALRQVNEHAPRRRRQVLLGLGIALAGGWLGWRHTALPELTAAWTADHRAGTGPARRVVLADGTQVWLNAQSAFNVDYTVQARTLTLLRGEILIQTAADAARPFRVDTAQGRLRALGTRFTVRLDDVDTLLAVYEGAVEVSAAGHDVLGVVGAGQQARLGRAGLGRQAPADPARAAWAQGVLIADGITLAGVVEELGKRHSGHISLAPELARLPVFGSYPLDDAPRALDMLASVMPITVRQTLPWWTSVTPRR